jgi:hypothetical protein
MSDANLTIADVTLIPTSRKDLDLGSLWTWTVPLWGLLVIVVFLLGILSESVILESLPVNNPVAVAAAMVGSGRRRVRFSNV